LNEKEDSLNKLIEISDNEILSILYAARNAEINQAIVLKEVLEKRG